MPRTLPHCPSLSLSLYFSRHIGIASDRIRKRHVWHILSAKAKPKFDLAKNKLKQQMRKRKSWQTFFPSSLPSFLASLLPAMLTAPVVAAPFRSAAVCTHVVCVISI